MILPKPVHFEEVVPDKLKSSDDGDDWLPAFQRADADARIISLRNGVTYELSGALRNTSDRLWRGNGATIRVDQANPNAAKRAAFMLGDQHPAAFKYASPSVNQFPVYDVNPVSAGDTKVTLVTAGNQSAFTPGQFVWVRHVTEVISGGINYPLYAQLAKVYAVPGGGVIALETTLLEAIPSACISPIGSTVDAFMGYPFEVVENVTIDHLTIENSRGLMSTRTGAYHCDLRDVVTSGCEYLVEAQAWSGCSAERISGAVTGRICEIKMYSQDSVFDRVRGRIVGNATILVPFDLAEQSNRNTFRHCQAAMPTENASAVALVSVNGWLNAFEGCEFIHVGSASGNPVVQIPSNNYTGYGPNRNQLKGGRVVANGSRTHHLIIGSPASTADPIGYLIDGTEFLGTPSSGHSVKVANGGVSGHVARCALPVVFEIASGATAPSESGNSVAGLTGGSILTGTASALGTFVAESGTIYQQRAATVTRYPVMTKTGASVNQGWVRMLTLSGLSIRGDADFTNPSTLTPEVQDFTATLTANRYVTLPVVSAGDPGFPFIIRKLTNNGAGKLGVKDTDGTTILAELPAANKGAMFCNWTGTAWDVLAFAAL